MAQGSHLVTGSGHPPHVDAESLLVTLPADATVAVLGERGLRRHIERRVPLVTGVIVGPGEDAAVVQIGPSALVAVESLVEGAHFDRAVTPAALLGRKSLTMNLVRVAAMGGVARYATVSLCVPPDTGLAWVDALLDGMLARASETGVGIVSVQVAQGEGLVVGVGLLGDGERLLLRRGAKAGDRVVVTGSLGAAAEGLRLLADGARLGEDGEVEQTGPWTDSSTADLAACLRAQLDPRPPLALMRSFCERGLVDAAMGLRDGLANDLGEMCARSGLRAVIESGALPIDAHVRSLEQARGGDPVTLAVQGAGDHQFLLAAGPEHLDDLGDLARVWGVETTAIGEFVAGEPEVWCRDPSGERPIRDVRG